MSRSDSVMREPEFVRFLVARGLSGTGTMVTLVALPVIVFRLSDSASLTALVAACEAAPYLLFGLLAGALTDRWDRRRVMVASDLLSAVVVASLPVAYWLGALTVPHVLAVAFLSPALGVFFDGSVFGALPLLVGRDRIAVANSLVYGVLSAAEITAPAVVGIVLAVLAPADLLVFDAASFLVSAVLIGGIARPLHDADRERPQLTLRQVGRDIREGLDYLVNHAAVRTMTIISCLQCVAGGGFVALMVVWIARRLGAGTQGLEFGVVYGSWAVGGILAAALLPLLLRRLAPARITLLALPFSAVGGLLVPLADRWWTASIGLAAWSVAYTMVVLNAVSFRQAVTPEPLLGRVNTAGRMLSWGMGWTGGAFLAGALAGPLGVVPTMEVMGLAAVAGVVIAWTSPLRSVDEEEPRIPVFN